MGGYVKSFFDVVFEKYGNENIIMLRFTACSYYVDKDKNVQPIPDFCKKPWQANEKYNKSLRELEERIIMEYNPHVIDYSKYYIGDSELSEDIQGAHFSVEYYKESFKAIKEIIFGTKKRESGKTILHYTKLSLSGIAEILKKELSQEEFKKMWEHIESPVKELNECGILKRLAQLPNDIIISNRLFISEICELVEEMSYIWECSLFSDEEMNYLLVRHIESHKEGRFTQEEMVLLGNICKPEECILDFSEKTSFSEESLLQKFKVLFENEDIAWIEYLMAAEQINPDSLEVLQYMKYYAIAIEDWDMVDKYEKRINRIKLADIDI